MKLGVAEHCVVTGCVWRSAVSETGRLHRGLWAITGLCARHRRETAHGILGACLSSDWSSCCESDSMHGYEQGISRLEDRRCAAAAAAGAGLCAGGPPFAADRVAGPGEP